MEQKKDKIIEFIFNFYQKDKLKKILPLGYSLKISDLKKTREKKRKKTCMFFQKKHLEKNILILKNKNSESKNLEKKKKRKEKKRKKKRINFEKFKGN